MAERKTYTDAQKAEILKKAEETSIAAASKEFGVTRVTIMKWKAANQAAAEAIEAKKTVRAAGQKAKAAAEKTAKTTKAKAKAKKESAKEVKDAVAAEAADKAAAEAIEVKKTARAAGRKAKAAAEKTVETTKAKAKAKKESVKGAAAKVARKIDDAKLADQMAAGRVKTRNARKKTEKATVKEEKAAVKAADKEEKIARKPAVKKMAVKVNMVFQSTMGGAVTPGQIAMKLPKDTQDVYVKLEENKAYYVLKDGSTGSIDIWD